MLFVPGGQAELVHTHRVSAARPEYVVCTHHKGARGLVHVTAVLASLPASHHRCQRNHTVNGIQRASAVYKGKPAWLFSYHVPSYALARARLKQVEACSTQLHQQSGVIDAVQVA